MSVEFKKYRARQLLEEAHHHIEKASLLDPDLDCIGVIVAIDKIFQRSVRPRFNDKRDAKIMGRCQRIHK